MDDPGRARRHAGGLRGERRCADSTTAPARRDPRDGGHGFLSDANVDLVWTSGRTWLSWFDDGVLYRLIS